MTDKEIEGLEFREIAFGGGFPFHYKKVEVNHQMQNVNGLTMINGQYFTKEYSQQVIKNISKELNSEK